MVCDICWTPDPVYGGTPSIAKSGPQGSSEYLFGAYPRSNGAHDTRRIDLCPECLKLFQKRDWKGVADRAHSALIRQLES